jgi:hypothetical protein
VIIYTLITADAFAEQDEIGNVFVFLISNSSPEALVEKGKTLDLDLYFGEESSWPLDDTYDVFVELLTKIFDFDPTKRPTALEALALLREA